MTASGLAMLRMGLVIAADILTVAANWPYIRAVQARIARPRLVTWLVFAAATAVAAAGSFRAGQWPSGVFTAALAAGCLGVLLAGLRHGSKEVGPFGVCCLALGGAGVAVLAWSVARPAMVPDMWALAVSCGTDLIAILPTYAHGWLAPDEEPPRPWAMFTIGGAMTLAASVPGAADAVLWPAFLLAADGFMLAVVLTARKRDRQSSLEWRRGQLGYEWPPVSCRQAVTSRGAHGRGLAAPGQPR